MKLGISMYCYVGLIQAGKMDFVSFIQEAKRLGAEGVELLDFFYKDIEKERKIAKSTLADTGLICSVFSVSNNFVKTSEKERGEQVDRIRFGVDEAIEFETDVVRVFSGDIPADGSLGFDQARGWIIDGLAESANYAHSKGVKLALENHGHLAGKWEQVKGIIDDVRDQCGHDALGANPDTGNFVLVGQDGHLGVENLAGYAYMVHFKDFAPTPDGWDQYTFAGLDGDSFIGTVVGEGTVNLEHCVSSLKSAGFDGWLNLEYEAELDAMIGVEKSFQNARKFIP